MSLINCGSVRVVHCGIIKYATNKDAHKVIEDSDAVIADNDKSNLKDDAPTKRRKSVVTRNSWGVVNDKTPAKAPAKSQLKEKVKPGKPKAVSDPTPVNEGAPKSKCVSAQFVEDDDKIDFEIEAPTGEFSSKGELSPSDSESDDGKIDSQFSHSQSSSGSCQGASRSYRLRSQTRSRSVSHSCSHC